MTSTVIYQGDLRTEMTHLASHNTIHTDAPKDNHGKGEAFSPTDLVATALGSCLLSIMGIYAKTHDLDMTDARAEITKTMAAAPRRIAQIDVTVTMPARNFSEKDRRALEHAAHTCPVAQSLSADLKQVIDFVWL